MNLICDVCGKSYAMAERCTHCGASAPSDEGIHQSWATPKWGWLTISLPRDTASKQRLVLLLKGRLQQLEKNSVMSLLATQVVLLNARLEVAHILTRRDLVNSLVGDGADASGFKFQEVQESHSAGDLNELIRMGPVT